MAETTHGPSARSERLSVRLVGAERTTLSTAGMFEEDAESVRTTLLYFDVLNRSDERVVWDADAHKFVDADGYLYTTLEGFDVDDANPAGWYRRLELEPGTRGRCVAAVDTMPRETRLARILYHRESGAFVLEDDADGTEEVYELDVSDTDLGALGAPPFEG